MTVYVYGTSSNMQRPNHFHLGRQELNYMAMTNTWQISADSFALTYSHPQLKKSKILQNNVKSNLISSNIEMVIFSCV